MGGVPPLGYDAHPDPNTRELVVNEKEAQTVRRVFDLYDYCWSVARQHNKEILFEIGTEEIPAGYIVPALEAMSATLSEKVPSPLLR